MILRIITPEGVCEIWKFGKKTNRRAFLVGSMTLVNCSLAIKEADIIYQTPPENREYILNDFNYWNQ
nr:MAG TPA: hypothetical protein [Caudoviricetes sp.]